MNFEQFKTEFGALCLKHKAVESFHYGGVERILARVKTDMKYPAVWFEEPEWNYLDNGGTKSNYITNLLVLEKPTDKLDDLEDKAKFESKAIIDQILAMLIHKVEFGEWDVEFKITDSSGQFKSYFGGDADVGADVQLTLTFPQEICIDPEMWDFD